MTYLTRQLLEGVKDPSQVRMKVYMAPFIDDGSPYSERIRGHLPRVTGGQTLYRPEISYPGKTQLLREELSLVGALERIRQDLARNGYDPTIADAVRPTLSYGAPEAWLRRQPGFDANALQRSRNFHQKLGLIQQLAQGEIDGGMDPQKRAELETALREIDEHTPIPGVPIRVDGVSPDFADSILDLWAKYKEKPSSELMATIRQMVARL